MNTPPRKRQPRSRGRLVDLETLWHDLPAFARHLGLSAEQQRIATATQAELAKGIAMSEKFDSDTERTKWLAQLEKMRWGHAKEMLWLAAWSETFGRREAAIAKRRNLDSLRDNPGLLAKHLGLKLTKPQRRWLKEAQVDLQALQQRERSTAYISAELRNIAAKRKRVADGLIAKAEKQELPQVHGLLREIRTGQGLGWGKPPNAKPPKPISLQEQKSNQNSKNRDRGKGYTPAEKEAKMWELRRKFGSDNLPAAIKAFVEWSGCSVSTAYAYAKKIGWTQS